MPWALGSHTSSRPIRARKRANAFPRVTHDEGGHVPRVRGDVHLPHRRQGRRHVLLAVPAAPSAGAGGRPRAALGATDRGLRSRSIRDRRHERPAPRRPLCQGLDARQGSGPRAPARGDARVHPSPRRGGGRIVETAAAGDLAHRTAWARLLADVARRRVDLVMVWKLDRAFRSTLHALATLKDFEHAGVGFSALTQPELDTRSAAGRLVFTILAAVAEMERELIADRVREGMRHAARRGARIGRPPVTARPGFATRWTRVQADLAAGHISRRQAARRLGIGTATLARLLAAEGQAARSSNA
ncbi:MAG TPA: recombinase family protein [Candidatus Saccharimonadales bacterium]|nr:recombinase family protein [Candidatus Saccharimonadales bacterium]